MVKLNLLSRKLTRIGGVKLSIATFFPTDKVVLDSRFNKDTNTKNIALDFPCFIRFELPYVAESITKRYLNLTYMGKLQMISTMQAMLNNLDTKEVFVKDPDLGLTVTKDLNKDGVSRWVVAEVINGNLINIYPTVIHEEANSYEGIGILINEPLNRVEMTISEFIALQQFLKEVDIWSLSQAMFNTALMLSGQGSLEREPPHVEQVLEQREMIFRPRGATDAFREKQEKFRREEEQAAAESNGS